MTLYEESWALPPSPIETIGHYGGVRRGDRAEESLIFAFTPIAQYRSSI